MVQFNPIRREVNCKIVYYGPGLSGKTTNLEIIHQKTPVANKGNLTAVATEQDRTLFFDFMPMDIGKVAGMNIKLRLFTVPGQVFYNSTRKVVLQGVDGLIFIADSQKHKLEENIESFQNLQENLKEYSRGLKEIPLVLQWNKRDLPNILPVDVLEKEVNILKAPTLAAVASAGKGVFPTLKKSIALVLSLVTNELNKQSEKSSRPSRPAIIKSSPGIISSDQVKAHHKKKKLERPKLRPIKLGKKQDKKKKFGKFKRPGEKGD